MGMHTTQPALRNDYGLQAGTYTETMVDSRSPSPVPKPVDFAHGGETSTVSEWMEMWDYVGGIRFRGFGAENGDDKAMFVFFDQSVVGGDLKAGLTALLELCEVDYFSCDRLVVCIDRHADKTARDTLTKDLGWIGFSLTTLDDYSETGEITSDKWLFMDMEV